MNKRIIFVFTFFIFTPFLIFCANPHLLLHFDLNNTIIASDLAMGKSKRDVVIQALAEKYQDRWVDDLSEPISYYDYVHDYLLPGSSTDLELRKKRNQKLSQFLEFLQEMHHPLSDHVRQEFESIFGILESHQTELLASFHRLITYLQDSEYSFSILLRTFGMDLELAVEEIETLHGPNFFTHQAHFKEGILHTNQGMQIQGIPHLYQFFKDFPHIAIRDDWFWWNQHGGKRTYSKIFPIDLKDSQVFSIFFDDNIRLQDDSVKNIVNPVDMRTGQMLSISRLVETKHLYRVDTVKAIVDDFYFINLVEEALTGQGQRQGQGQGN